jgi:PAS domain S-box-containing protein
MDPLITILSSLCLASAFITFGLGIAAYVKNPLSAANRLFCLAMLSATYWAFAEFMIWQTPSPEGAGFWLKASSLWPFVIAFTIHFVLSFTSTTGDRRNIVLPLVFIYLPAGIISLILFFTSWIFVIGPVPGFGYSYFPVVDSPAYTAECLYILLMMLYATWVIFSFWQHASTKKIRSQAMLLCVAISTVIFFGFLSGILLPAQAIYLPNLVFIGLVLFSVIITFAIQKHELFILSPRTAVPDILRTMPDAMILADSDGTIISTNESTGKIFGLDCGELPGKTLAACIPEAVFAHIHSVVREKGMITDVETSPNRILSRTISIAGSRVLDPCGEPAGMVLIIRDVTDRKTAETALRIAGEKISLLTKVTRHDINNLISALSGYLLLLKENPCDPANEFYIESSMDITEKIHNQLQFTREYQDVGSREPVWQPLDHILFRTICDLPHEKIQIVPDIAEVEIYSDTLMVKVLYNILENAIRHGEHVTRIQISAMRQENQSLRIIVEDDGIGIRQEDKERIFQYGFGKNTGLGLALSRDILSLTGITITETGTPGTGARFELIVPPPAWRPVIG